MVGFGELLPLLGVVLISALGIIIMLRGGRSLQWRFGSDRLDALGSPSGVWAMALLSSVSLAELAAAFPGRLVTGSVFGLLMAIGLGVSKEVVGRLLSIFCLGGALILAYAFVDDRTVSGFERGFRVVLLISLVVLFIAGASVGHRWTFMTTRGRGFTILGIVDFVTFAASPAGVSLLSLDQTRQSWYLAVVGFAALILGLTASEFTVWVAAGLATLTSLGLSLTGGVGAARFSFVVSTMVVFALSWTIGRRLFRPFR